jgi:hypothetical protein
LGFLLEKTELFSKIAQCKYCNTSTVSKMSYDGKIRKYCEFCGQVLKDTFITKFSDEIIKLADKYKKTPDEFYDNLLTEHFHDYYYGIKKTFSICGESILDSSTEDITNPTAFGVPVNDLKLHLNKITTLRDDLGFSHRQIKLYCITSN